MLTDGTPTLQQLYGFPAGTTDAVVLSTLSNAVAFTRRLDINYDDLIELLRTRFINPHGDLIPKWERLGLSLDKLKAFKDGVMPDSQFEVTLTPHLDPEQYGGEIKAWVKNQDNFDKIMSLLLLADPTGSKKASSFDKVEFRYADPAKLAQQVRPFEFVRLLRFIRLWKKLGWNIEHTDKAITALYPAEQAPNLDDDNLNRQRLDAGFLSLLPRLGVLRRVMNSLNLSPQKDLLALLACFAPMDTYGSVSLYRKLFLSPSLLNQDSAFADDGFSKFLNGTEKLFDHREVLRAALAVTDDEISLVGEALGFDANTKLTVENISTFFRHGWLARKLKLSVKELLLLIEHSGIDPFATIDPVNPPILAFISLLNRLRVTALKPSQALYLIWNRDLSGKSAPDAEQMNEFARSLRAAFAATEVEFGIEDDPDGQIARSRMALVYDNETTDLFFGLLNNTLITDVPYNHSQPALESFLLDAAPGRIAYDDFRKRLTFGGVMTPAFRDALKVGAPLEFEQAVDKLLENNQRIVEPFFERYPELRDLQEAFTFFGELKSTVNYTHGQSTLEQSILTAAPDRITYDQARKRLSFKGILDATTRDKLKAVVGVTNAFQTAVEKLFTQNQASIQAFFAQHPQLNEKQQSAYIEANDAVGQRRSVLLGAFLPELKQRRKRQQALQAISAAAKTDSGYARAILEDVAVLHGAVGPAHSALEDFTAIETTGLSAEFFFRDTATGAVDRRSDAEANLAYNANSNTMLPGNAGNPISGIWSGYLEAPSNGFYNIRIETDAVASATLEIDGTKVPMSRNGNVFHNDNAIELRAGTLYAFTLKVEKVKDTLKVRWQTTGRGWEIIPDRFLYPATLRDHLNQAYIRFFKVVSLGAALKLSANEMVHLTSRVDYQIGGQGWLNSLPVAVSPDAATSRALFKSFEPLLYYSALKSEFSSDDERLLAVLQHPEQAALNRDSLLFAITRWEPNSLSTLLTHFAKATADLAHLETLNRVSDAYRWVTALGISANSLIKATTNGPTATIVRDLQAALRARYAESDWLSVVKPINDELRVLQRDALVAYILHQMRSDPESAHIDTPDKLFEYFLMDVQMEPCMQTSRVRHALSSVQLFVERCLMNLEKRVASSAINAKQWDWMKRYRVWEANRKVFLWPENWLEPELRDDQSPFFKETISELLQGDITEDRAATALLNYLSKLGEVAKLEPCGIHFIENDPGSADDVAHVVARTTTGTRNYYYRRSKGGSWSPWDQIKLEIEDNPVIPVVWKSRLFLFWPKILKQAPQTAQQPVKADKDLIKMSTTDLKSDPPRITVKAILCWSEYFNGKWQPAKTSDVNRPTVFGDYDSLGPYAFANSGVSLCAYEEGTGLRLIIRAPGSSKSFFLYNTHSLPIREEDAPIQTSKIKNLSTDGRERYIYTAGGNLAIKYYSKSSELPRPVFKGLSFDSGARAIQPCHLQLNAWGSPFFFEDSQHVFYVSTDERVFDISEYHSYTGTAPKASEAVPDIPPIVLIPHIHIVPDRIGPISHEKFSGVVDTASIQKFVKEDAYINKSLGTGGTVRFGGQELGPAGALGKGK